MLFYFVLQMNKMHWMGCGCANE